MIFPLYDLHCHSNASDGTLSPEELFHLALEKGIKVLALTDHDTIKGYLELSELQRLGKITDSIQLISGAEFSCQLDSQILHVIGLNMDTTNSQLLKHIDQLSSLRMKRAEKIAEKLSKKKIDNTLPLVIAKANGAQIGRPHFAEVLCDLQIVQSPAQAFKKYLGAGKSANVKVDWPELEQVLNIIKGAGGVAVLAHPTKYNLTMSKLRRIIEVFKLYNGDAIEISYPGINKEQQNIIKYEAKKHMLYISAGSDFHTLNNKWIQLGSYPMFDSDLPHVLSKCS